MTRKKRRARKNGRDKEIETGRTVKKGQAETTMDCFEAPRMGLNLIFIKVSAAPTGALGPWKVEEP